MSTLEPGVILMRYIEADDFGKPSNVLSPSTFWFTLASDIGLLSEDIDPRTGELGGASPTGSARPASGTAGSWEEGLWHAP